MTRDWVNNSIPNGYKSLVSYGITNKYSDDYGSLATAKLEEVAFALCCEGRAHYDVSEDNCERCGLALFWQRKEKSLASFAAYRHKEKYRRAKEEVERKRNEKIMFEREKARLKKEQEIRALNAAVVLKHAEDFANARMAEAAKKLRDAEITAQLIKQEISRKEAEALRKADEAIHNWWVGRYDTSIFKTGS